MAKSRRIVLYPGSETSTYIYVLYNNIDIITLFFCQIKNIADASAAIAL